MTASSGGTRVRATLAQGPILVALIVSSVVALLPFVWVFSGAFRSTAEIRSDPGAIFPTQPTLDNIVRLFADDRFPPALVNSVLVAAMVVGGNLVFASMLGYALAKLEFRGRRLIFGMVLASLMIPFAATFVPQFILVAQLRLVDTLWGIALPVLVTPLAVFIMRQFALGIPDELIEAARIDGASEWRIFAQVFVPLAAPAMATQAILTLLGSWNSFIWPLVIAQSETTYTLPVALAAASAQSYSTDYGLLLAGALLMVAPILTLFLFLQRYFVQGIATTGLR